MSIPSSVPPPPVPRGFQGKGGRSRREANLRKYGTPLPLLLPSSPLHPASTAFSASGIVDPVTLKEAPSGWFGPSSVASKVVVPSVVGTLDRDTASVWVEGEGMEVLFNRGFFGKGTLSRSDPNWRRRRIELVRGGDGECGLSGARRTREKEWMPGHQTKSALTPSPRRRAVP